MASAGIPPEVQSELTRLKNEVHAKDETLNQLKLKTKAFVDNMRGELAAEKKKVTELEEQLKHAKDTAGSSAPPSSGAASSEVEALKKEMALVVQRENELKAKAKSFADNMKAQVQSEKEKSHKLEQELAAKIAALALAQASVATSSASHDLLSLDDPTPSMKDTSGEVAALHAQLQAAQHELAAMTDRMRNTEDLAAQRAQDATKAQNELASLQSSSTEQLSRLQAELAALKSSEQELERSLSSQKSAQGSSEAALAVEHSQLQDVLAKHEDAMHQLQQYKIENEHLQKQLLDKDFLLEQLESYRERADESEAKAKQLAGELAAAQSALQASSEEAAKSCAKCDALKLEFSEITTLYEKVNIGRSQSDIQLAEAQSALSALQNVQQSYAAAKERVDELSKQNMELNEAIFRKESEVSALKSDVQRLTTEVAALQAQVSVSRSDSLTRRQESEAALADKQKTDDALRDVQAKCAQLEKKNQELVSSIDSINRENNDKRQKAKALVISLTNEKQTLVDARSELQKEVDRLRMELNQRNVETERRLKQLQDENSQRVAQSSSTLQSLSDEIATLKQTLAIVQESEKNQQRAKELANAKREVEDSNKKRLAAKAETQKLAVELESVQKCLSHLSEHANTNCASSVRKMTQLHERVSEALQVLEKRAQAASGGKKAASQPGGNQSEIEVEDLREPESVSGREKPTSPTQSARKVEENIAGVNERLTLLVEAADKLCEMAMEQNEVNLKDVVLDKATQFFTQCFSEKLRTAYAKVEEADVFSDSNQSSSRSSKS